MEPNLLTVAREAASTGAAFLADQYAAIHTGGQAIEVHEKTSAIDLVTDIDGKAQTIIIDIIRSHFPDHRFLAEEEGADSLGNPASPFRWIIDPLDGTTNYIHGRDSFGSIVAVEENGILTAGAMNLPLKRQEFYGARGQGAFVNGTPVILRNTRDMNDAVLSCNIRHRAKEMNGTLMVSIPPCCSVENYGCAAEELGEVLLGHNDGVFFDGIRLWDVAVGFLLIEEAGGRVAYQFEDKNNHRSGLLCAGSTVPIFDELWEWIQNRM